MSLPEEFLTQLEQYGELSQCQRDIFLEIFCRGKSRVQVAEIFHISDSNLSTHLSGIYKKFKISASGPVKENRLREYLSKRYTQSKITGSLATNNSASDINVLVQEIRDKVKPNIKDRCGKMQVLDMTYPIELTGERGIYTSVNILEKITSRRRMEVTELLQNCNPEDFDRFGLNRVSEERVPGLTAVARHNKLMVLGKPGAGKTTFLKYLAMQCNEGDFHANLVPIFIPLKDFAELPEQLDVIEYITHKFSNYGITDSNIKTENLLKHGKALVLLDGLDEVREDDTKRVVKQIREFAENFRENHIVVTCRIAASEFIFEGFIEVEVADFDFEQIKIFVNKWFQARKPGKAEKFIQKLEEDKPLQELATNPLLLTLLCLIFEERGKFKNNRAELYEEGIELLLERWDDSREIDREQIYKNLSIRRKEDLLSKIGFTTFTDGDYFFKVRNVEKLICDYIYNLSDIQNNSETLQVKSKKILKSIVAQHGLLLERATGIYSFSHLTFHEYFAAREIVTNSMVEDLAEHLTEKRWREVFLLTAGMMSNGTRFIQNIKQKIDESINLDKTLQNLLIWINNKTKAATIPYKNLEVRAIYLSLILSQPLSEAIDVEDITKILVFDLAVTGLICPSFFQSVYYNAVGIIMTAFNSQIIVNNNDLCLIDQNYNELNIYFEYNSKVGLDTNINSDLAEALHHLEQQLPNFHDKENNRKQWQEENRRNWIEQLRSVMIKYRNIGHDWKLSPKQKEILQQYYDANKLLLDCLNSDCYVNREVRQEIEDTLLLPISEIEKRYSHKAKS